jgi:hypothetical protein
VFRDRNIQLVCFDLNKLQARGHNVVQASLAICQQPSSPP